MPSWAYCYLEAARTRLPFAPDKEDPRAAMDLGGPTFNAVLNFVALHPEEIVLGFLDNMQRDRANLTKYASVLCMKFFLLLAAPPMSSTV
jgi:hypothetical protein